MFEPKFQLLELATASQIVSHTLRVWRLIKFYTNTLREMIYEKPWTKATTEHINRKVVYGFASGGCE